MIERQKGPIEILCNEIEFRFECSMERPEFLISFVAMLIEQVADMRHMQAYLGEITKRPGPSSDSEEVLRRTRELIESDPAEIVAKAEKVHDLIHKVEPDVAYPCDHLIDMLSSCVSAIRFGLETPCHSRHAASAASHIWKHRYGVTLFDEFTPNWEKDWARAQLQRAILVCAIPAAFATSASKP